MTSTDIDLKQMEELLDAVRVRIIVAGRRLEACLEEKEAHDLDESA